MSPDLFNRAVDPRQYDGIGDGNQNWGAGRTGHEAFFTRAIAPFSPLWQRSNVLEVGCGTGWLMDFVAKNGAHGVVGIEPSSHQVAIARSRFPDLNIHHCSFQDYLRDHAELTSPKSYGLVVSHMSISHIPDLNHFFKETRQLLSDGGHLLLTVPNPDYFTSSLRGELTIEPLSSGESVVTRPGGTTDLIRSLKMFTEAALGAGFRPSTERPVVPDEEYRSLDRRYAALAEGQPIAHSFAYAKQ